MFFLLLLVFSSTFFIRNWIAQCWETCNTISSHQQAIDQNQWQLRIASMIKQEFLVATHLAWEPANKLINCLVTWEVFGGGLMGNLLTDSANVELSLWPDTKYRVQVTCKNEVSIHSLHLFVVFFLLLLLLAFVRYTIASSSWSDHLFEQHQLRKCAFHFSSILMFIYYCFYFGWKLIFLNNNIVMCIVCMLLVHSISFQIFELIFLQTSNRN